MTNIAIRINPKRSKYCIHEEQPIIHRSSGYLIFINELARRSPISLIGACQEETQAGDRTNMIPTKMNPMQYWMSGPDGNRKRPRCAEES